MRQRHHPERSEARSAVRPERSAEPTLPEAVLRLQHAAGNQATTAVIQRFYQVTAIERHQYSGNRGWDEDSIDDLGGWAKSERQFHSVIENVTADEWTNVLLPEFPDGSQAPTKAADIRIAYQRRHTKTDVIKKGTVAYRGLAGTTWTVGKPKKDWSGCYLGETLEHSEGYLTEGHDATKGTGVSSMWECTLKQDLAVQNVGGAYIVDANIGSDKKAALLKFVLDIPQEEPLLAALGKEGQAYFGQDTGTLHELVIPWNLLDAAIQARRIYEYDVENYVVGPRRAV